MMFLPKEKGGRYRPPSTTRSLPYCAYLPAVFMFDSPLHVDDDPNVFGEIISKHFAAHCFRVLVKLLVHEEHRHGFLRGVAQDVLNNPRSQPGLFGILVAL